MKKPLFISAVALLTALLLFSGYQVWKYFTDEQEIVEQYDNLAARI